MMTPYHAGKYSLWTETCLNEAVLNLRNSGRTSFNKNILQRNDLSSKDNFCKAANRFCLRTPAQFKF